MLTSPESLKYYWSLLFIDPLKAEDLHIMDVLDFLSKNYMEKGTEQKALLIAY